MLRAWRWVAAAGLLQGLAACSPDDVTATLPADFRSGFVVHQKAEDELVIEGPVGLNDADFPLRLEAYSHDTVYLLQFDDLLPPEHALPPSGGPPTLRGLIHERETCTRGRVELGTEPATARFPIAALAPKLWRADPAEGAFTKIESSAWPKFAELSLDLELPSAPCGESPYQLVPFDPDRILPLPDGTIIGGQARHRDDDSLSLIRLVQARRVTPDRIVAASSTAFFVFDRGRPFEDQARSRVLMEDLHLPVLPREPITPWYVRYLEHVSDSGDAHRLLAIVTVRTADRDHLSVVVELHVDETGFSEVRRSEPIALFGTAVYERPDGTLIVLGNDREESQSGSYGPLQLARTTSISAPFEVPTEIAPGRLRAVRRAPHRTFSHVLAFSQGELLSAQLDSPPIQVERNQTFGLSEAIRSISGAGGPDDSRIWLGGDKGGVGLLSLPSGNIEHRSLGLWSDLHHCATTFDECGFARFDKSISLIERVGDDHVLLGLLDCQSLGLMSTDDRCAFNLSPEGVDIEGGVFDIDVSQNGTTVLYESGEIYEIIPSSR